MTQLAAKQIKKFLSAWVGISSVSVTSANNVQVTTPLTTALNTAGDGGTSVPLQQGSSTQMGVLVGSTDNHCQIFDATTNDEIIVGGNQVYGRITFSTPNYIVSFYTLVNGTETACTLNQSVNILAPYRFDLNSLPADALIAVKDFSPGSDANPGNFKTEVLTVTGNNTFSNLSQAPINPATVKITVNGQTLYANTHFTVSGNAISISGGQATAIGYTITTTDFCEAEYWA